MDPEPLPISDQPSKSIFAPLILTFCAISALPIFMVYSKNFIFGSSLGHWLYPYFGKEAPIPLWLPAAVLILLVLIIFMGSRLIFSYEKRTLLVCFFIAVFMQILILKAYPTSLESIVKSDQATSFYSQAMAYSPVEILGQFTSLARSLPQHARTNMPGKILLFQLLELITKSPEFLGYLIIAFSTSGALLLYGICKNLFRDRRTAFYAFILYTLIPCKLFFFPILNTVTPVFMLLSFYLFLSYIDQKKALFLWLLGGSLYMLVLFEPSPLVTGILYIGILIYAIGKKRLSKKDFLQILIIPTVAFLGVYLFFIRIFSFDLLQTVEYVAKDAVNFNIDDLRDYQIWLGENSKEFFFGVGLPIMMIFIFQMVQIITDWKILKFNIKNWLIENVFSVSLLVTFLIVLFSGLNRGETTRLWIYLAVLFQVPAAFFMARISKGNILFFFIAGTLVAQSFVTLHRVAFIVP